MTDENASKHCSTKFEVFGEVVAVEHPKTLFKVPFDKVVMFQEVCHCSWAKTMEPGDYAILKHREVVQVVGHMRVYFKPCGTPELYDAVPNVREGQQGTQTHACVCAHTSYKHTHTHGG